MDSKKTSISIIVPVYNVEQYLDECISSLLNQTYTSIEIILVDDGSKDSSGDICDKYVLQDARVRVIHKVNGGLSDARNAGLGVATGDYIMFVDSDDYITADAAERFVDVINQQGLVDVVVANGKNEPGELMRGEFAPDIINSIISGEEYLKLSLNTGDFLVGAQFSLYKRQFLSDNNLLFEYGILHEDVRFTSVVFCLAKTVSFLSGYFYHYRNNPTSIMNRKDYSKNCRDIYDSCKYLEDYLRPIVSEETFALIMEWLVRQYLGVFRRGKCYQYGKEYIHKDFVKKYSMLRRTKAKSLLFRFSPRLYCHI